MLNRKEYKLLVEGWRQFIIEGESVPNKSEFIGEYLDSLYDDYEYDDFEDDESQENDDFDYMAGAIEWSPSNKLPVGTHGFREGTSKRSSHVDLRKSVTLDGVEYKVDIHFAMNPVAALLNEFLGRHYLDKNINPGSVNFSALMRNIIEYRYKNFYSSVFDKEKLREQVDVIISVLQQNGFSLIATSSEEKSRTAKYITLIEEEGRDFVEKKLRAYSDVWNSIAGNKSKLHKLVWDIIDALLQLGLIK